jgi:hypothetical protein
MGLTAERSGADTGTAQRSTARGLGGEAPGTRRLQARPGRSQAKAERFIQAKLAGSAYPAICRSGRDRAAAADERLRTCVEEMKLTDVEGTTGASTPCSLQERSGRL